MTSIFTDRKAGIKITFVGFFGSSPSTGDSVHRLSLNLAKRRRPPIFYSLPKLKIFGGHLGNSGPENTKKLPNNLENARKKFISLRVYSSPPVLGESESVEGRESGLGTG